MSVGRHRGNAEKIKECMHANGSMPQLEINDALAGLDRIIQTCAEARFA